MTMIRQFVLCLLLFSQLQPVWIGQVAMAEESQAIWQKKITPTLASSSDSCLDLSEAQCLDTLHQQLEQSQQHMKQIEDTEEKVDTHRKQTRKNLQQLDKAARHLSETKGTATLVPNTAPPGQRLSQGSPTCNRLGVSMFCFSPR